MTLSSRVTLATALTALLAGLVVFAPAPSIAQAERSEPVLKPRVVKPKVNLRSLTAQAGIPGGIRLRGKTEAGPATVLIQQRFADGWLTVDESRASSSGRFKAVADALGEENLLRAISKRRVSEGIVYKRSISKTIMVPAVGANDVSPRWLVRAQDWSER